jgi:YHS domain-containing protein
MFKPSTTLFALTLGLFAALNLGACGTTEPSGHEGHDHADHAGHDHAAHADVGDATAGEEEEATAGAEAPAMEGMAKVDPEGAVKSWDAKPEAGAKGICPVSGEAFMVTDATVFSVVEGKFYGYCCPGCQGKFEADPQSFLSKGAEG